MGAAGIALAVAGAVGGGLQGWSQWEAGKAEKDLAYYNARLARERGYAEERAIRRRGKLLQGELEATVAASGVTMEGSPLELAVLNAAELERDAIDARTRGVQEAEYLRVSGRNAKVAGGRAFATGIIAGAIGGATTGYRYRPQTLGQGVGPTGPAAPQRASLYYDRRGIA